MIVPDKDGNPVSDTLCRCRTCGDQYEESKSRAEFKGYCSAGCLHEKSKKLGYRKPKKSWDKSGESEYNVLKRNNQVGSIFVKDV